MRLPGEVEPVLMGLLVLAAAVWIGGFVMLVVVSRVTSRILAPRDRVALFRAVGRSHGLITGSALAVAMVSGGLLLASQPWTAVSAATTTTAAALVCTSLVGVFQARRMTRYRRCALERPDDLRLSERIRRGARLAQALRTLIGVLSLGLLALGVLSVG